MAPSFPDLEPGWRRALAPALDTRAFHDLAAFVAARRAAGAAIYPPAPQVFRAFELTPFDAVQVVILGQDPYHGPGQAHGLAFSVPDGVRLPPSLRNIFKEYATDLGRPAPTSGDLTPWARRGVLLLNTVLTVEEGAAASHARKGWEAVTGRAVEALATERERLVFVLWGDKAQALGAAVDPKRHGIVQSPHPSPLSAHRGFLGSKPFTKANAYRAAHGLPPVDWTL